MSEVVVEETGQWDGRYPFDVPFDPTLREWIWIKDLADYYPLTFEEGFRRMDAALVTVVALISMRRAGKISVEEVPRVWERWQDLPVVIRLELGEEEEPEDPMTASETRSDANENSAGTSGSTGSEASAEVVDLPPTGTHGWGSSGSG